MDKQSDTASTPTPVDSGQPHQLKLVMITHFFPNHAGGIELVADKLACEFAKRQVQVRWFSSNTDEPPHHDKTTVHHVSVGTSNFVERFTQLPYPLWTPCALPSLWRAIGAADVVLVHEHLYAGSIAALVIARLLRRPAVITQHMGKLRLQNAFLTWLYELSARILGQLMFPFAERRVFVSENVRQFFGRQSDPRSIMIFNGVDTACFTAVPDEERQRQRESMQIETGRIVVIFAGRFVRKKGLFIIEQLTHRFPSVLWIMVGSGPDDPRLWSSKNVRVSGRLTHAQLADCYRCADLLLLPSSGEGFPLVVQEALCCGTGVLSTEEVSSACAAASSLLRYCTTSAGDMNVEKWESSLAATLSDDAYVNSRQSRSQVARSLWSWEMCADQYMEQFSTITRGQR